MIFVYVIKSKEKKFRYIGITNDYKRRLEEHNQGKNKSTKFYRPFDLISLKEYSNYKEARKIEKFLKSGKGREFLEKL